MTLVIISFKSDMTHYSQFIISTCCENYYLYNIILNIIGVFIKKLSHPGIIWVPFKEDEKKS